MLHSAWGCSEFLEFNATETWNSVKDYLGKNPTAEYYRFDFEGRKSNDQPFYSLIPTSVLKEIFNAQITLPISTKKGLTLNHNRYHSAILYLGSAWNTAIRRAPIPPTKGRVTLHDVRDTFRTRCTLLKISFEASEFALGHELDQKGYNQCFNDEPWMWSELRKLYGPVVATESALQERDKVIEAMQQQIDELKKGGLGPLSKEDVGRMIDEYLSQKRG
jgi:hypothetical protein